jgi:hypothetical protein
MYADRSMADWRNSDSTALLVCYVCICLFLILFFPPQVIAGNFHFIHPTPPYFAQLTCYLYMVDDNNSGIGCITLGI